MKKWINVAGVGLGIFLLLAVTGLMFVARGQAINLVHHYPQDRRIAEESPADYDHDFELVDLVSADGVKLAAWYIPSTNGAAVMAQHGFKSDKSSVLREADILARHGYGVLMLDVRAHGDSEGDSISFGHFEMADLDAGYQYLLTRSDVDPD